MAKVILGVTISLDGFAEDEKGSVAKLYPDLETLRETGIMKESICETAAVVMSKKEFEMPDDPDTLADEYEYQVPIFVFTDQPPAKHPKENGHISFTFVTDGMASAVQQARTAAGEKSVTIIGSAATVRECLQQKLADELHLEIIPVFLEKGARPFETIGEKQVKLERIKVVELPAGRTHIRFRVVK